MGHHAVLVRRSRVREGGQAIIMVTLALIAMCGLMGLAVDFGWAYFVKRSAQAAADAAAIAAAEEMRRIGGYTGPYTCAGGGCRSDFPCPANIVADGTDNLKNGCVYARYNGPFVDGGRQRVRIQESVDTAPPTAATGPLQYWVTVRISESVPQLFAAITGNPIATVSARATAGLYQGKLKGAVILTNRETDTAGWSRNALGANLDVQGNSVVNANGGILLASTCGGNCGNGNWAGYVQGTQSRVVSTYTNIRGAGNINDTTKWTGTISRNMGDGPEFMDPTKRKTNPPVSNSGIPDCPIVGGSITAAGTDVVTLSPGNYFAVDAQGVPTGNQIQLTGNFRFQSTGTGCVGGGTSSPSNFGTFVFYGGLKTGRSADTSLSLESGALVFAGAEPQGSNATPLFDAAVGGRAFSITGPGSDAAGNLFVFTDPNYPGLTTPTQLLPAVGRLKQGVAGFKAGGDRATFDLDGLRETGAGFPSTLKGYNEFLFWQDRRNSKIMYNDDGSYACSAPYTSCDKSPGQQLTDGMVDGSGEMSIWAGASTRLKGTIYQPRGGWTVIGGSGSIGSTLDRVPLQIITGAMQLGGGANVNLKPVTEGVPVSIVGLVE